MTTFVEFRLLDPDLQTVHGILPFQKGDLYLQLNEPGSGSVKTALDIASAALVESGGFVEAHYRAAVRGGFFVENLGESDVNAGEEAGRGLEVSGRGALALLEDAVVWTDGTGSNKRTFSGTQAAMLISLIEAAQTRGGLGIVDWDFTATLDSDGVAWTDDFPLELTVGTSLLDVVRQIAKTGIDFEMNPDGSGNYVLSAYKNGIGSNKSGTVYFRVGVNCTEVSHSEAGGGIRNALLVKYKGGYTSVQDATSITARRRRESALNYDFVQRPDSAGTFANAELQGKKNPKKQISVKVYDGAGPRAFVDYVLGDTVTLDVRGAEEEYRIRGIHLSWAEDGNAEIIVDMNSMILENEIRVTQDLDWLLNEWKTAHDAGLLEVAFWAAIGDKSITYQGRSLAVSGDIIYTSVGAKIWQYDSDNGGWSLYGTCPDTITCLAVIGSDLYASSLLKVYRYVAGTGSQIAVMDDTSEPSAVYVWSICEHDGKLAAGGYFNRLNGAAWTGVGLYDPASGTWTDIGGGTVTPNPDALNSDGINLYAGIGMQAKQWDGATWSNLGASFSPLAVLAIYPYDNTVVAGTASDVYILEGGSWNLLGGGLGGAVYSFTSILTDLYVGGNFTGGVRKYSAGTWYELEEGVNNLITDMVVIGANLYVSGSFTTAGGKSAYKIAAYITNFDDLADYLENTQGEFNLGEAIHNATAKTSLTGADEMPLWDSISQALRKITWTNIIASIKTWADTIYVALTGNQTIAGIKTFSSFPVTPSSAPTTDYQVANKKYVDDNIGGGGGTPGGSDTQVQYNNGGAFGGDAEFTWDDVSKVLAIGDMTLIPLIAERTLRLAGYSVSPSIVMHAFGASYAPHLTFEKADLSAGPTFENVKDDQVIGRIRGKGWDGGAGWTDSRLEIRFVADGDWASGDTPTRIELYTCPDGSGTLTLAMTIRSDGHVDIGSGKEYWVNGSQHQHSAANITSGTMATARLGSGTASASTALHGDQTYKTVREVLTADRTYYVRTDGSDSNDGLANTAGGAFLTIQKALNVAAALDNSIYNVTITVADGTYTENLICKGLLGTGILYLTGNTSTPANCIIAGGTGIALWIYGTTSRIEISGFKTTGSSYGILAQGACVVIVGAWNHATSGAAQIYVDGGAQVTLNTNYTISAGAARHWWVFVNGYIQISGRTVTLSGTPAFSSAFADCNLHGTITAYSNTFSGAATGKRYNATKNGIIDTNGAGATALPGNSAGTTATGGQYV